MQIKNNLKIFFFLLLSGLLLAGPISMSAQAQIMEDAIIAIVNDEVITLKDLQRYIRSTYISLATEGVAKEQIQKVMDELRVNGLEKLIEDKLILSHANAVGIMINKKAVDERLASVQKRYPDEQSFLKHLIDNGITITDLRNKIQDQLKIQYIIQEEVKSKIYIAPQEVTDFYKNNPDLFRLNERIDLDSIYVSFEKNVNKKEAEKKAEEALERIRKGEPFSDVAKQVSETPAIGVIERGKFLEDIENIVFSLNEGDISNVVEVGSGFYIFKLKKRIEAQVAPLEDIKPEIENLLYQQKLKDRLTKWIDKLKKDAYIEKK